MGCPRWGWRSSGGHILTRHPPPDKAGLDKGAANTCRSWRGPRFSPLKRRQLPTVMGIKLREPDGGLRESGEGRAGREREPGGTGRGRGGGGPRRLAG